jgi:hypothetical protein
VADVLAARSSVHPVRDLGDTRRELLELFDTIIEYTRGGNTAVITFLLEAASDEAEALRRILDLMIIPRRDAARAVLQRGIARGDLPADLDIDALLDLWNGLASYRQGIRPAPLPQRTIDQLVDLALAGHAPRLVTQGD